MYTRLDAITMFKVIWDKNEKCRTILEAQHSVELKRGSLGSVVRCYNQPPQLIQLNMACLVVDVVVVPTFRILDHLMNVNEAVNKK